MTAVTPFTSIPLAVTSDENSTPCAACRNASVVLVRADWLMREWISQTGYSRDIAVKSSWAKAAARAVGRNTMTERSVERIGGFAGKDLPLNPPLSPRSDRSLSITSTSAGKVSSGETTRLSWTT